MAHNVTLAVYDLSHGMASQLGEQFLGFPISMIPHTGVIVYGKEYFFGGGIQSLPHQQFTSMYMQPIQIIPMGTTEISLEIFEEFLEDIQPRYTPGTYDLIRNNCNNFSDEIMTFLVGKSVPIEITGLPERVFSSPMGQMLRPMIEQTQSLMRGAMPGFTEAQHITTSNPWASSSATPVSPPTSSNPWAGSSAIPVSPPTSSNPWAGSSGIPVPPPTSSNPWAGSSAIAVPPPTTSNSSSLVNPCSGQSEFNSRLAAVDASISQTKVLRPLLSTNTSVVGAAVRQLRALGYEVLSAAEDTVLGQISESVTAATPVPSNAFKLIHTVLTSWPERGVDRAKSDFMAMCLLRLLVLQPSAYAYMSADGATRANCLDVVFRGLRDTASPRLTALRLTVVANLFANASGEEFVISRSVEVREAAMFHLARSNNSDIRQMASACLYNLGLALKPYSSDLLRDCLSGLMGEEDEVVLQRRVITASVLLRRFTQAKISVKASGLDTDVAASLVKSLQQNSKEETKQALRELNGLLA